MRNRRMITLPAVLCLCCAVLLTIPGDNRQGARSETPGRWQAAAVPVALEETVHAYAGPGTRFEALGSFGGTGEEAMALSAAYDEQSRNWWIQTELTNRNEKIRFYTEADGMDIHTDDLPEEKLQRDVVVNRTVYAYRGPGYEYAMCGDPVPSGTEGRIWQTDGGYAQLEFEDDSGMLRRVWVQENALEAPNG